MQGVTLCRAFKAAMIEMTKETKGHKKHWHEPSVRSQPAKVAANRKTPEGDGEGFKDKLSGGPILVDIFNI